jgi:hypothetical protein
MYTHIYARAQELLLSFSLSLFLSLHRTRRFSQGKRSGDEWNSTHPIGLFFCLSCLRKAKQIYPGTGAKGLLIGRNADCGLSVSPSPPPCAPSLVPTHTGTHYTHHKTTWMTSGSALTSYGTGTSLVTTRSTVQCNLESQHPETLLREITREQTFGNVCLALR